MKMKNKAINTLLAGILGISMSLTMASPMKIGAGSRKSTGKDKNHCVAIDQDASAYSPL